MKLTAKEKEAKTRVDQYLKLKPGEYYCWSEMTKFTLPRCEFLLHSVKKIEDQLIAWCKDKKYSQGDDYSVGITAKGKWKVSYSNDCPLQHGTGEVYILTDEEFIFATTHY